MTLRWLLSIALMFSFVNAKMFQSVEPHQARLLQSGKEARYCGECGMDLVMFYKTSHAARIDGKEKQFCSIHCLVEAMRHAKQVTNIRVVDTKTLNWIDAKNAYYVVGSDVKGTMSRISKYAFAKKSDAEAFQKRHGGKIMRFQKAFIEAQKDFN